MGAGVDHRIGTVIVGAVGVVRITVEGELQHPHAGAAEALSHALNGRCDLAQVLGYQGQRAQGSEEGVEQFNAGALPPAACRSRRGFGGDRPVGLEGPEVVQSKKVEALKLMPEALNPPLKPFLLEPVPAIQRVAPVLSFLGEGIGRNAGDFLRVAGVVKIEQVGTAPHIDAVVGHVNGEIPEKPNAPV